VLERAGRDEVNCPQPAGGCGMKIFSFNSKSGTTLVELVVALLIIALVILVGGMFFVYGRVNIIQEAHRRAALLVASQRLEALKAADYSDITPQGFGPNYDPYYIVWGSDWDPRENLVYDYVTVVASLTRKCSQRPSTLMTMIRMASTATTT